jgi:hypothetical protein
MLIKVTEQDIKNGRKAELRKCPIALVIARELGCNQNGTNSVRVGATCAFLGIGPLWRLPEVARKFIRAFDRGQPVSPIEFEMPELDEYANQSN